ncbi:hypothetical protein LCGC14_3131710 [marine sediment metagenome]|uniref:Uncharacterized protein n=1 Tax=marine sediment metagenome TaxID=412755 RepID=A0A0F8VZH6_9ZZZZ
MYWLILANGVKAVVLATNLTLAMCEAKATAINNDYHYAEVWAYCERLEVADG